MTSTDSPKSNRKPLLIAILLIGGFIGLIVFIGYITTSLEKAVWRDNRLAVWYQFRIRGVQPQKNPKLLSIAVRNNYAQLTQMLIRYGADPHARYNSDYERGTTLLHIAVRSNPTTQTLQTLLPHFNKHQRNRRSQRDAATALHLAAQLGKTEFVQVLLKAGVDPNRTDKSKNTPLFVALCNAKTPLPLLRLLIHQTQLNATNKRQESFLHAAAKGNQAEALKLLLQKGAKLDQTNLLGESAIHVAAESAALATLTHLVQRGVSVNLTTPRQKTPLHLAIEALQAEKAKLQTIRFLLQHKANPNHIDLTGESPLHDALKERNPKFALLLLQHGAKTNLPNQLKQTPVFIAARHQSLKIFRTLISRKTDLQQRDALHNTLLHAAANNDKHGAHIITFLLRQGVPLKATNKSGETALFSARKKDTALALLHAGLNPNQTNRSNETPLHNAAKYGLLEIARVLIQFKANPLLPLPNGKTPLQLAKDNNERNVLQFLAKAAGQKLDKQVDPKPLFDAIMRNKEYNLHTLIARGISPDAHDEYGQSPLTKAASFNKRAAIEILLQEGANINGTNRYKATPLQQAVESGYPELVRFFLDKGANPNTQDHVESTPLRQAIQRCQLKSARLLLQKGAIPRRSRSRYRLDALQLLLKDIPKRNKNFPKSECSEANQLKLLRLLLPVWLKHHKKIPPQSLFYAARYSPLSVLQTLHKTGVNLRSPGKWKRSLIHAAASHIDTTPTTLRWLHETQKLPLNTVDRFRNTPLHFAAANGYTAIINYLLRHGLSLKARNQKGYTPLLMFCHHRPWSTFQKTLLLLLQRGAKLDETDNKGQTCLHLGAFSRSHNIKPLATLLKHIQSSQTSLLNQRDKQGKTPLHIAARHHSLGPLRLLLQAGANPWYQDQQGRTPLHIATQLRYTNAVKFLQQGQQNIAAPPNAKMPIPSETSKVSPPLPKRPQVPSTPSTHRTLPVQPSTSQPTSQPR